ncbi:hypothetical protein V6N13_074392 [Hibiscus sabdariffa]
MDGFQVVVRAAKENLRGLSERAKAEAVLPEKIVLRNKNHNINFATLKDTRSYKEVLMGAGKVSLDEEVVQVDSEVRPLDQEQATVLSKGSNETTVMVVKSWPPQQAIK